MSMQDRFTLDVRDNPPLIVRLRGTEAQKDNFTVLKDNFSLLYFNNILIENPQMLKEGVE